MSSRDTGIIIDTTATLIATSSGFAKYEATSSFQVGDSVTFSPVYTPEGSVLASKLSLCPSILPTKIGEDGALLLEVKIQKVVNLAGGLRIFRTNFINVVQEGILKGAEPNRCVQRRVWIEYKAQKRAFEVVEKEDSEVTSSETLGFAYHLTRQDEARIYVPGFPEDVFIPRIPGVFEPSFATDTWFKFSISRGKIDLQKPIIAQTHLEFQHGGLIKIGCTKRGPKLETIHGEPIIDEDQELEARGVAGEDFVKKLWVKLDGTKDQKKPVLYLHTYQDQELPERTVKRTEKKKEPEMQRPRFPEPLYGHGFRRENPRPRRVNYVEQSTQNRPRQVWSRRPFLETSGELSGNRGSQENREFVNGSTLLGANGFRVDEENGNRGFSNSGSTSGASNEVNGPTSTYQGSFQYGPPVGSHGPTEYGPTSRQGQGPAPYGSQGSHGVIGPSYESYGRNEETGSYGPSTGNYGRNGPSQNGPIPGYDQGPYFRPEPASYGTNGSHGSYGPSARPYGDQGPYGTSAGNYGNQGPYGPTSTHQGHSNGNSGTYGHPAGSREAQGPYGPPSGFPHGPTSYGFSTSTSAPHGSPNSQGSPDRSSSGSSKKSPKSQGSRAKPSPPQPPRKVIGFSNTGPIYEAYTTVTVIRRKKSPESYTTASFKSFPPLCLQKTTAHDDEQLYQELTKIMENPSFVEMIREQFPELMSCFESGQKEKISLEIRNQLRTKEFYSILRQQFPEFLGKLKWILNF